MEKYVTIRWHENLIRRKFSTWWAQKISRVLVSQLGTLGVIAYTLADLTFFAPNRSFAASWMENISHITQRKCLHIFLFKAFQLPFHLSLRFQILNWRMKLIFSSLAATSFFPPSYIVCMGGGRMFYNEKFHSSQDWRDSLCLPLLKTARRFCVWYDVYWKMQSSDEISRENGK